MSRMTKEPIPYIKVIQNESTFVMMSLPVSFLKEKVNFHFRNPFEKGTVDFINSEKYVKQMEKKYEIKVSGEDSGLQRRTDIKRIEEISSYTHEATGIVFPTPIILSLNVFNDGEESVSKQELEDKYFSENFGTISYDEFDSMEFTVIDGQHRLAGLVAALNNYEINIDMPVTLVLGASLSEATEIFIQINGNQRKVDRSMIYDLYTNINSKEHEEIKKYVQVTNLLNKRESSPFFNMVKRLGSGTGTISQAFLIDNIIYAFKEMKSIDISLQDTYSYLFLYFSLVRSFFGEIWVAQGMNSSQIVKTNGVGALFLIMIYLNKEYGPISEEDNQSKYKKFFHQRSKFDWDSDEWSGTGKKVQKKISQKFIEFANDKLARSADDMSYDDLTDRREGFFDLF